MLGVQRFLPWMGISSYSDAGKSKCLGSKAGAGCSMLPAPGWHQCWRWCLKIVVFVLMLMMGVDVWRGVWRCTHAKLAPLTPYPLARDRHYGPASGQRGERFGAGNLSAPISPLLHKCADGATTLSLRFGIDQDLRFLGLDDESAACLRCGPAWIVFCFRCWVADGKNGGDNLEFWDRCK